MKYQILHRTAYKYATPVRDSFNDVRLHPPSNAHQTVESFQFQVEPEARVSHYHDFFSNQVCHFELPHPHQQLALESRLVVRTHPPPWPPCDASAWPLARIAEAAAMARCYDFLHASRYVDTDPETWRHAVDVISGHTDAWQAAYALMCFVHSHLAYKPNSTHVHTHMREVMASRGGVCQDFAHVLIGLCRAVKIPAAYVSGYLATETASATHAWMEVYIPGFGWQGLDPTHSRLVDETYVKIAIGRDYADVPPVSGHYRGTTNRTMEVTLKVEPC